METPPSSRMSTLVPILTTMRAAAATCSRCESSVRWDLAVPMAFLLGIPMRPKLIRTAIPGQKRELDYLPMHFAAIRMGLLVFCQRRHRTARHVALPGPKASVSRLKPRPTKREPGAQPRVAVPRVLGYKWRLFWLGEVDFVEDALGEFVDCRAGIAAGVDGIADDAGKGELGFFAVLVGDGDLNGGFSEVFGNGCRRIVVDFVGLILAQFADDIGAGRRRGGGFAGRRPISGLARDQAGCRT